MGYKIKDCGSLRYREEVIRKRKAKQDIEAQLAELKAQLRREWQEIPAELMTSDSWCNSAEAVAGD